MRRGTAADIDAAVVAAQAALVERAVQAVPGDGHGRALAVFTGGRPRGAGRVPGAQGARHQSPA